MPPRNERWLVLLVSLPPTSSRVRVGIWRKLKRMGAASLKGAAWILPANGETTELFQWLAQEIETLGGEAALLHVDRIEPLEREQVAQLFRQDRAAEYQGVQQSLKAMLAALPRGGAPTGDKLKRVGTKLAAAKRELERITRIDHMSTPAGDEARGLYEQVEQKMSTQSTKKPAKAARQEGMPPLRSLWVTRERPHIDRIASAWLIKRFYDPKARFAFAPEPKAVKRAIPFDVLGAEYGHQGEDCTFETILKRLGTKDRKLTAIAQIVHDADLNDGKFSRAEAAGLDITIQGLVATYLDDHELLAAGLAMFDGLYAALKDRK